MFKSLVIAAAALFSVVGTGCTPREVAFWQTFHAEHPAQAEQLLVDLDLVGGPAVASAPAARVAAPATPTPASADDVHCYYLVGGTFCAVDGTSYAADFARQQADYYASHGLVDPGPLPHSTAPNAPVFPEPAPEPTPENVRCFILAGGTFCLAEGTPEYEQAERDEAAYLASHAGEMAETVTSG